MIRGLTDASTVKDVVIFHAGTRTDDDGLLRADGGRVLNVTATGATLKDAVASAYAAVNRIDWPGGFCRRDIGWRALRPDEAAVQPRCPRSLAPCLVSPRPAGPTR